MWRGGEDCALVFNAIYGSDGRDDTLVDAPFTWNPRVPLSKLRIGYVEQEFTNDQPNPLANPKLLKDALDVFRSIGAKPEPLALPDFPIAAMNFILSAEAAGA